MKTALVAGGTGLIGGLLIDALLDTQEWKVIAIGRSAPKAQSPNIQNIKADLLKLVNVAPQTSTVEVAFCCLGTTIKTAGSRAAFYEVDYTMALEFGRYAKSIGVQKFLLVSALGADPKSKVFYNRVKGEIESALGQLGFDDAYFLRPSLLIGSRKEFRLGEKVAQGISSIIAPLMLGPLKRYRPIKAKTVARALVKLASAPPQLHETPQPPIKILESEMIFTAAKLPGENQ